MYTSSLSARRARADGQQDDAEHPSSRQDKQRKFAALMGNAPVAPVHRAASVDDATTGKARHNSVRTSAGSETGLLPAQFSQPNLRFSRIRWRITNGPLAGMTIDASSDEIGLHIRLHGDDRQRLQQVFGPQGTLEEKLSAQLNRTVTLEVFHAVSPNQ
ncbi:hypothetical protein [Serratia quinivorans]|uniref:hypothetical protein n=1 Tax=Serratia quinivorans TaxID=137545 RepID=UPI00217B8357|nr:hypothetical protein [Serratia quinivorans]CAI1237071.1 Uncharacterised protein [Serratia quinivorans]